MNTVEELRAAAGLIRVLVGVLVVAVLGSIHPGIAAMRSAFVGYVLVALGFEALILLRIGNRTRAIAGGLVDLAMLTLAVHLVGSASTFLVSMYVFACVLNALVVGREVALLLAVAGSAMYGAVLAAEVLGVIPYAGGFDVHVHGLATDEAIVTWTIVCSVLLATTSITTHLVRSIREREADLRRANARLRDLSQRDPLTDLWNRRRLIAELEGAFVKEDDGVAIAVVDLDGFKRVNDDLGHLQGDVLLCALASAYTAEMGARDEVCRFGGDEFVVLLRGPFDVACRRADALVSTTRRVAREFHPECRVTASVGLASARDDECASDLLRRADALAYDAKRKGGDRREDDVERVRARASGLGA